MQHASLGYASAGYCSHSRLEPKVSSCSGLGAAQAYWKIQVILYQRIGVNQAGWDCAMDMLASTSRCRFGTGVGLHRQLMADIQSVDGGRSSKMVKRRFGVASMTLLGG